MVQQRRRRQVKIDHSRQCWNCGKLTMEPVEGYYKCSKCGASWNETPKPGPVELLAINRWTGRPTQGEDDSMGTPSAAVLRRAAKARGDI